MPTSESSPIVKLRALKKEMADLGVDVLSLGAGDPSMHGFENKPLSSALVRAAKEGWNMYPYSTPFEDELKKAVANFEKRERNVEYSSEDIILTPGVAGAFQVLHYTLLDPSDEVLTFEPGHYLTGPSTYMYVFESKVVPCRTIEEKDWEPDLEEMRSKMSNKTKVIVISNPNNPTGAVYNEKILKEIVDVAGEYDVPIVSDEIYGLLTFETKAISLAEVAKEVPIIVLSGMSKIFQRTGWRLGYIAFHDPDNKMMELTRTAKRVAKLYGHATTCIPTPILFAAIHAFKGSTKSAKTMVEQLKPRRDYTWKRLNEIDGVTCTKPQGGFYAFPHIPQISQKWKSDEHFAQELLKQEKLMLPFVGSIFGKSGIAHMRVIFLPQIQTIQEGLRRLERFITQA